MDSGILAFGDGTRYHMYNGNIHACEALDMLVLEVVHVYLMRKDS